MDAPLKVALSILDNLLSVYTHVLLGFLVLLCLDVYRGRPTLGDGQQGIKADTELIIGENILIAHMHQTQHKANTEKLQATDFSGFSTTLLKQ